MKEEDKMTTEQALEDIKVIAGDNKKIDFNVMAMWCLMAGITITFGKQANQPYIYLKNPRNNKTVFIKCSEIITLFSMIDKSLEDIFNQICDLETDNE